MARCPNGPFRPGPPAHRASERGGPTSKTSLPLLKRHPSQLRSARSHRRLRCGRMGGSQRLENDPHVKLTPRAHIFEFTAPGLYTLLRERCIGTIVFSRTETDVYALVSC